jgi:hypothetical protein
MLDGAQCFACLDRPSLWTLMREFSGFTPPGRAAKRSARLFVDYGSEVLAS